MVLPSIHNPLPSTVLIQRPPSPELLHIMSASKLSTDLIHGILAYVPDFATLSAAICSSKEYYEAFRPHPKSILREVTKNVTGPAFLQAARPAHYYW